MASATPTQDEQVVQIRVSIAFGNYRSRVLTDVTPQRVRALLIAYLEWDLTRRVGRTHTSFPDQARFRVVIRPGGNGYLVQSDTRNEDLTREIVVSTLEELLQR